MSGKMCSSTRWTTMYTCRGIHNKISAPSDQATNMKTSAHVCLRRIHGYRLVNTKCMNIVDQWKKLSHANLVSLRQVFTTKSFADHSMVFVYDLYAGAETLMSKHFNSPSQVRLSHYIRF